MTITEERRFTYLCPGCSGPTVSKGRWRGNYGQRRQCKSCNRIWEMQAPQTLLQAVPDERLYQIVVTALRECILAHGPITTNYLQSAVKRVIPQLANTLRSIGLLELSQWSEKKERQIDGNILSRLRAKNRSLVEQNKHLLSIIVACQPHIPEDHQFAATVNRIASNFPIDAQPVED